MKNIGSNIVNFFNKLKMGKMIRIVMKNKWVLLSLVFLILFYYFFYSIKEGVTNSPDADADSDADADAAADVPMSQKTEGAFDTSVNNKIKNTNEQITKAEGDAELIKGEINTSIEKIQDTLTQIVNRNYAIDKKFPSSE
mgnify:CR=1 FL=1|jgi:peptidoglycan hydrolase CwlO-like protein